MSGAIVIDGRAQAASVRREVADAAARLRREHGIAVGLATILVGDDPASQVYVGGKQRACAAAGFASFERHLPATATTAALLAEIAALNDDDRVDGILVQLPLPAPIAVDRVTAAIAPDKDVDGFHPVNVGNLWSGRPGLVPCTPQGCVMLLRSVHADLTGAAAIVVGRSQIVGRPIAALLVAADCTVTILHSRSRDAAEICRQGDVVVAASGHPLTVTRDWVKPGATIIDVGVNRVDGPDGAARLVGDVDYAAVQPIAGAITPVPGGVGPMTIACLLRNTVLAACRRRGLDDPFAGAAG